MHLSQTTYIPTPSGKGKREKQIRKRNTESATEKFSLLSGLAQGPEKQHQFQEKPFVAAVALNWSTHFTNRSQGGKKRKKKKKDTGI